MNEQEKMKFVKELRSKNKKLYGFLSPNDAVIIHKLRKARGKE